MTKLSTINKDLDKEIKENFADDDGEKKKENFYYQF
tara:strand:+ start:359 stop:466 length:108 start_codon:yes stop_codon:yes gene_type:complete